MTQRTPKQNNSLHLFCEQAAEALTDAGYDIQKTIVHQMDVPWSATAFKELIWRQAQKTYLGKVSTTELTTKEVDGVYDVVNRYLSQFGIHIPWPHETEESIG